MTDGTSQGLFIVVAIVIFGIFTVMAYILFEDTLSPALANMFTEATEQATYKLNSNKVPILPSDIVPFRDKYLEKAIRDELGLTNGEELTLSVIEGLEKLSANVGEEGYEYSPDEMNIKYLDGLQYAKKLHTLSLHGNDVRDLTPIKNLTFLREFNSNRNRNISNVDVLGNLTELRTILMSQAQIDNIDFVKNLPNLLILNISGSKVTDISPLINNTKLNKLYIGYTNVSDISVVSELRNLKTLSANNTNITDYTPAEHVTTKIFKDIN